MTQIGTRDPKLGNLIKYEEGTHVGYCRDTVTVDGSTGDFTIGVLVDNAGAVAALKADIYGVVLENATEAGQEVAVLVRGPAGVADDALVLGAISAADAKDALEGKGIKVMEQV